MPELLLHSPEHFDRALTWYLIENPRAHYDLRSGGTTYRFYLFRSERRSGPRFVACKVVTTPRNDEIDAYGSSVARRWACDECGGVFEKHGRRKFCSGRCGARARKRRFLGRAEPRKPDPRRFWRDELSEAQIWEQDAILRPDRANRSARHVD